jgi:glyoxylase-like metal-dependent hydrolase (beta-lactamase superfamily II)
MYYKCPVSTVIDFPLISYYLENADHKIIVDTGGSSPEGSKFAPYTRTKEQELDQALAKIGVDPKDIDIVILTHLHWDHSGNNRLFPNARFICQRKEYEYLLDPATDHRGYEVENVMKTTYELVDGDCEIVNGISVVLTPGHTVGLQCVVVGTTAGKYILSNDLVTLFECWETKPRIPNAANYDVGVIFDSLEKIERISDLILPGHDSDVFTRQEVYPYGRSK